MAITATTLASPAGISDPTIVVAAATGFAPGLWVRIDQELCQVAANYLAGGVIIPVMRGRDGTASAPHPSGAKVIAELASDYVALGAQQSTQFNTVSGRDIKSYSASGAITLPIPGRDLIVFLNGTSVLAMTLANPTADMDGCRLLIAGNGKAAHTVTYAAGLGNGGAAMDVGTAAAGNQCAFELVAAGGFWCYIGLPSATGAANAFIFA
jgi:hypothetical protein